MTKMKRVNVVSRVFSVLCLCLLVFSLIPFTASADEDGKTEVILRYIMPGQITFSQVQVKVERVSPEREYMGAVGIYATEWTTTILLPPGIYDFTSFPQEWEWSDYQNIKTAYLSQKNVKVEGDVMTIYFVAESDKYPAPVHPTEPVIYGEDTQEIWIWGPETTDPIIEDVTLPPENTGAVPIEPNTETVISIPTTQPVEPPVQRNKESTSQIIGTAIFIVIMVASVVIGFIVISKKSKAHGQ